MRVYHFLNKQYGLAAIANRRLKASRLDELNDPFEFLGIASKNRELRRAMRNMRDELAKHRGLHCFSSKWTNPLLWSHYAEKHRGLCLGFDVPDNLLIPVDYVRDRLPAVQILIGDDAQRQAFMKRVLATKFEHWHYESEYRLFVELKDIDNSTGLYFTPFTEDLRLGEVFVGAAAEISRKEMTDALGDYPTTRLVRVRAAFQSFDIVENKNAKLWR